ncbi:glycosyltransferase family 39 protein [Sphingobacterium sp. lm-10]|uniref:glycosyltransferase family 39 protein n=1 Tax=Sphingobacterium sp. lm-10 TaxID=2944904 RepID=UPI00202074A1|nr:glycosyltransferase family 39 protein [Sphingobacterium sp. lm-10]MCL7986476.1 glycosyltransferase family 39 protein [Sphingobacterium sp. lm-10]
MKNYILVSLILAKFLIQFFLISPEYELHRDELLHLDQANHLAWGYLSVPPATSWISYLIKLLGNSIFWIKFFPALFGALTILAVWKTIEALKGNLFALLFGSLCVTFSVLFRLNTLYQPNSLDVLCWTSFYFFLIKFLNQRQAKWIYLCAIIFALGFLNKYNMIFLLLGLLPALMITKERRILLHKNVYYGVAIVIALITPNLIWQFQNNFPVFHHLNELSETQLVHVDRWNLILSLLLYFPGTFVVILFGLYALARDSAFEKYRTFFWSFFSTILIFLFFRAKDYYAIGIYPIYFAFGSVYIASLCESRIGKVLKPILIALPILFFIPIYNIAFPNKDPEYIVNNPDLYRKFGMLKWEDGKEHSLPQDFADMLGWKELAYKVDRIYSGIPNKEQTLILCDNYGQAGAINYYSKQGVRAVSFSADYLNWFDFQPQYINLIRVKNANERNREMAETSPYFEQSLDVDSVTNPNAREHGTVIFCFLRSKIDINERVKKEVEEEQAFMKR